MIIIVRMFVIVMALAMNAMRMTRQARQSYTLATSLALGRMASKSAAATCARAALHELCSAVAAHPAVILRRCKCHGLWDDGAMSGLLPAPQDADESGICKQRAAADKTQERE